MEERIIIESGRPELHYWLGLWRYRELFWVLVWRDLAVRYKQTIMGANPALARDADFYHHFWTNSQVTIRWISAIRADGFCWHASLDLFCNRVGGGVK